MSSQQNLQLVSSTNKKGSRIISSGGGGGGGGGGSGGARALISEDQPVRSEAFLTKRRPAFLFTTELQPGGRAALIRYAGTRMETISHAPHRFILVRVPVRSGRGYYILTTSVRVDC